jgi:hypothetical protein
MATNHVLSFLRQLRSNTSLDLSPPRAERTDCNRSRENLPSGKRKDVIITYIEMSYRFIAAREGTDGSTKYSQSEKRTYLVRTLVNPILSILVIDSSGNL